MDAHGAGVNVAEAQRLAASGRHEGRHAGTDKPNITPARDQAWPPNGMGPGRRQSLPRRGSQRSFRSESQSSLSDYNGQWQSQRGGRESSSALKDKNSWPMGKRAGELALHLNPKFCKISLQCEA